MAVVVKWNGNDLPEELRALPAGRYVLESVDAAPALTPEQDAGIQSALDSLNHAESVDSSEARRRIDAALKS